MAKTTKVIFYTAPWCNGCTKMKPLFYEACKKHNMPYEVIDVEDADGVERSIKYNVRVVPTLVFMRGGNEIGRAKGNDAYKAIEKYADARSK